MHPNQLLLARPVAYKHMHIVDMAMAPTKLTRTAHVLELVEWQNGFLHYHQLYDCHSIACNLFITLLFALTVYV